MPGSIDLRKLRLKKMTAEQRDEARIEDLDDLRLTLNKHFERKCEKYNSKYGKELRDMTNTDEIKRMKKNK